MDLVCVASASQATAIQNPQRVDGIFVQQQDTPCQDVLPGTAATNGSGVETLLANRSSLLLLLMMMMVMMMMMMMMTMMVMMIINFIIIIIIIIVIMMNHGHEHQQQPQQHMHSSRRNNLNHHNWMSTKMYEVTGDSSDQNRDVTFHGFWFVNKMVLLKQ